MNFRTYNDLQRAIRNWSGALPEFDLICGIPRSGMLAASMLALHRNRPCLPWRRLIDGLTLDIGGARCPKIDETALWNDKLSIVLIDDSSGSGQSLIDAARELRNYGLNVRLASIYVTPEAAGVIEFFHEIVPLPRAWEWNVFHHRHVLAGSVVDIDGVLCADPTPEENDDGERYQRFLAEARPIVIPSVPIGTLCTNRLEKYRAQTVAWLARHGVTYGRLVMAPYASQAERRRANRYAVDKSKCVLDARAHLMIESHPRLAGEINQISGVATFCPTNSQFWPEP